MSEANQGTLSGKAYKYFPVSNIITLPSRAKAAIGDKIPAASPIEMETKSPSFRFRYLSIPEVRNKRNYIPQLPGARSRSLVINALKVNAGEELGVFLSLQSIALGQLSFQVFCSVKFLL